MNPTTRELVTDSKWLLCYQVGAKHIDTEVGPMQSAEMRHRKISESTKCIGIDSSVL